MFDLLGGGSLVWILAGVRPHEQVARITARPLLAPTARRNVEPPSGLEPDLRTRVRPLIEYGPASWLGFPWGHGPIEHVAETLPRTIVARGVFLPCVRCRGQREHVREWEVPYRFDARHRVGDHLG